MRSNLQSQIFSVLSNKQASLMVLYIFLLFNFVVHSIYQQNVGLALLLAYYC